MMTSPVSRRTLNLNGLSHSTTVPVCAVNSFVVLLRLTSLLSCPPEVSKREVDCNLIEANEPNLPGIGGPTGANC